jgi:tryptophan halogenase
VNLFPHWLAGDADLCFCFTVCRHGKLCDDGLDPMSITTAEYDAVANYSYHLNAGKFAPFLQRHCCEKLGVRHVPADVRRVNRSEDGDIRSLDTEQAGEIEGDLFVDCTGFKALLIGETLGVRFKECSDVLFCDSALAVQVPYESDAAPIASHTISTAQSAGWIWVFGLHKRRGVGHVYSRRHISNDAAER